MLVLFETATKIPSSGLQQTPRQDDEITDLAVQLIPSGEVITRFVPVDDTAQNIPNAGLQHTELNTLLSGVYLVVQLTPSVELAARIFVPVEPTDTKMPNSGLQHTEFALFVVGQ
jgi:hypothetical protein